MATEQTTAHHQAQQPDTAVLDMIQALKLSFDVMILAGDAVEATTAKLRDVTAPVMKAFDRAHDEHRVMVEAVRSMPALSLAEALAKLNALNLVTEAEESYPSALAANNAAFVADVARIAEAGQ